MGANNGKLAGECTPDMTAMACHAKDDFDLKATAFELHPPGDDDVAFDVKFCVSTTYIQLSITLTRA